VLFSLHIAVGDVLFDVDPPEPHIDFMFTYFQSHLGADFGSGQ
jgi:hypothetical protein